MIVKTLEEDLIEQISMYLFVNYLIFISILLTSVIIYFYLKNSKFEKIKLINAILMFLVTVFLTLAKLCLNIINVMIMQTSIYLTEVFDSTNNRLLFLVFVAGFLCLANLIIIIKYWYFNKNKI